MKSLFGVYLGTLLGETIAVAIPGGWGESNITQYLSLRAATPLGSAIDRKDWRVTCNSAQPGNECKLAIDGDRDSFWHTAYGEDPSGASDPKPPHTYTVDLRTVQNVNGLSVLPRQDGGENGWIARHNVFLSTDGKAWGEAVATGTWYKDSTEKVSNFETKRARYVRLVAVSEVNDNPWTSIAELNIFKADSYSAPAAGIGKWGPTLDFPVIPVSGTVDPVSGKVMVWSSWRPDTMDGSPGGLTLTSTWDPATGIISQRDVTVTNHDMFCPGISLDGNGQLVVTGGNQAERTSLYDPVGDQWIAGPDMKLARGYQASATTSDGSVFTIGGSWGGGSYEKNGEVYNPKTKTWKLLSKAPSKPMLTADTQGLFRSDNHAWLFGWKQGTIFQAGPSTAMNWYYTKNNGDVKAAGNRESSRGVDPDAMCGNAVMFDAAQGKILTFGGSPNYQYDDATTNAHIITIGNPGTKATVDFASNGLWHPRIFHTSVLLADGSVFITGGQEYGIPFADSTPQLTPELYKPDTDEFIEQQPNSIVRVYHHISLLLPDGRVFNGGGGLCGDCNTNHFDAQIFTPNYLYTKDGKLATRPKITSVSAKAAKVGATITVKTNAAVKTTASFIRYGTSTHTVNTDQRRIPLTLAKTATNTYKFTVPSDPGIALPGYWMLFVMSAAALLLPPLPSHPPNSYPTSLAKTMKLLWTLLPIFGAVAAAKNPYFILTGDSTTAVKGGWGDGFLSFLKNPAAGINVAKSGATTVSFRNGGYWATAMKELKNHVKDYEPIVTIQFGHNDQKSLTIDEFTENLTQLAKEVKEAGGTPILITSLTRRRFENGEVLQNLKNERGAAIYVAKQVGAKYLDLNMASTDYLNALGEKDAQYYNLDGTDRTHLNLAGEVVFGRMVADLLLEKRADLGKFITPNKEMTRKIQEGELATGEE
ncbi:hypothetical protein FZEAL_1537 [Fusarium zealandicum]|uniref:F5/8 type C domain-containing protein n=1 Tax=Fusarium zealandicum TaxID=1053134 RepID=A0A8H4UTA4_9HYPO|nr:hypothetical protein FZEAL_1537 [Fusarium zealandicum]